MEIYLLLEYCCFHASHFILFRCIQFQHCIHQVYFVVSLSVEQRIKRLLIPNVKNIHVVT